MVQKASTLLMFGATGDLARRMLLPSLYGLDSDGLLPPGLRIIGTARTALDDASFRRKVSTPKVLPSASSRGSIMCRSTSRTRGSSDG